MNKIELRGVQKSILSEWYASSCLHDFHEETPLERLYDNFTYYCDSKSVFGMSKKMFSILLKEYLRKDILKGSVKVQPASRVLYRGVYIRNKSIKL